MPFTPVNPTPTATPQAALVRVKSGFFATNGLLILPDVVVREHHVDSIEVTRHPTMAGVISDHAFALPKRLSMTACWRSTDETDINDVYNLLRVLQDPTQTDPFSVTTAKRQYTNMMLKELSVTTEHETYYTLRAEMEFQEVLIVDAVISNTTMAPVAQQAAPEKTAEPVNQGKQHASQTAWPKTITIHPDAYGF